MSNSITVDGIAYDVEQFSEGVQQAVSIYSRFQAQLGDEQLAVIKTQAALQTLNAQLTEAVKSELAAKTEEQKPAEPAV